MTDESDRGTGDTVDEGTSVEPAEPATGSMLANPRRVRWVGASAA